MLLQQDVERRHTHCRLRPERVQTLCRGSVTAGCGLICWASWDALVWNHTFHEVWGPSVESLCFRRDCPIVWRDWRFLCLRMSCVHAAMLSFELNNNVFCSHNSVCWMSLWKGSWCSSTAASWLFSFSSLTDFVFCISICTHLCVVVSVCGCLWCPSGTLRWDTIAPTHPSFWWAPSWIYEMTRTPLRGCGTRSFPPSPTRRAWPWRERLEPWSTWSALRWPSEAWRRYLTRPSGLCSAPHLWRRGGRDAPCSKEEALLTLHHITMNNNHYFSERMRKKTSESECALLRLLSLYRCFFKIILVGPIFNPVFFNHYRVRS